MCECFFIIREAGEGKDFSILLALAELDHKAE